MKKLSILIMLAICFLVAPSESDGHTVWSDNFDDGDASDWLTGGTSLWGLDLISYSGSYSVTDSPAGNYQNNTDSLARAPVLDLSSYSGANLEFKLRGISESGYDFLYVQASTDLSTWTSQSILIDSTVYSTISGTSSGNWLSATVDLGAYDGESTVYIMFRFFSDGSITYDGWYVDDVTVEATATTSPAAPSGLSAAAASTSQINLSWTDNSSLESSFKIERKTGSGGTYSEITTVSANVTTYSNTGLSAATTYYYRVRAYNSAGNSNYSSEANATTPSAPTGGGGGGCFIATAAFGSNGK